MDVNLYALETVESGARGDIAEYRPLCTRAELWAAIEAAWYEAYQWGLDGGSATDDLETDAPALVRASRQDVRALLGMEAE